MIYLKYSFIISILFFVFFISNVHAEFYFFNLENFSYIRSLEPGTGSGGNAGLANEDTTLIVYIGKDHVAARCGKTATLSSSRNTDQIIVAISQIECQFNTATFTIRVSVAGASRFFVQVEQSQFTVGDVSFFMRRPTGSLIRSQGHAEVFFIKGNDIFPITSAEAFNQFGFDWKKVVEVPQEEEFLYDQKPANDLEIWKTIISEGSLITSFKYDGNPDIFIVNQYGFKRLFLNPIIYSFYGHLKNAIVKQVPSSVKESFGTSSFYQNCEIAGGGSVYTLAIDGEDTGVLHPSGSGVVNQQQVFCINNQEFVWYPKG